MTQEEKARAYDEALERAKMILCNILEGSASVRDIETIFPELRESEDERIRKWLIEEMKIHYDFESRSLNPMVEKALIWLEKQKEQKPAEWSEEDEKHKEWILECLADGKRKVPEYAEQYQSAFDWLKSLHPSWKPSEEQMEALKKVAYSLVGTGTQTDVYLVQLYEQLKKLM